MKVVDQTPFYKDNGELSLIDRVKATMQFGTGWFKEIEGQKVVVAVLEKILDKNYTLLRNVIPPGMNARIPFILVGPTGVYVMYVTAIVGMFRAKGDQWGTISGNTFKPENPNLLTRTERMARAVEVFVQRQGYSELPPVEAILLCSDPSITVDSLRPIIRVVMRDALERFAVSITQARVVLNPESVHDVVNRILKPPPAAAPEDTPSKAEAQAEDLSVPGFAVPGAESVDSTAVPAEDPFSLSPSAQPAGRPLTRPQVRQRSGMSRKQVLALVVMLIVWCLLAAGLGIVIFLNPFH